MLLLALACLKPTPTTPTTPTEPCPRVYLGHEGIYAPPHLIWPPGEPPTGLDPLLAELIGTQLGCPLVRVEHAGLANAARFTALEEGVADLSIFAFSVTPARKERVAFTRAYTRDGVGLIVATNSPYQSWEDLLSAKKVNASPGSTAEAWVHDTLPDVKLRSTSETIADAEDRLNLGTYDALAGDWSALQHWAKRSDRVRLLTPQPLTDEPWAVAVQHGDTALKARLNKALMSLETDGSLPDLRDSLGMLAP